MKRSSLKVGQAAWFVLGDGSDLDVRKGTIDEITISGGFTIYRFKCGYSALDHAVGKTKKELYDKFVAELEYRVCDEILEGYATEETLRERLEAGIKEEEECV